MNSKEKLAIDCYPGFNNEETEQINSDLQKSYEEGKLKEESYIEDNTLYVAADTNSVVDGCQIIRNNYTKS